MYLFFNILLNVFAISNIKSYQKMAVANSPCSRNEAAKKITNGQILIKLGLGSK
jgi:cell fate (sporulation/competence/biofilm development) regulator YmcA (YheA/YmcA/DUF963 family)